MISLTVPATGIVTAGSLEDINGIVAIVNDDVIVRSELNNQIRQLTATLQQNGTRPPPIAVLERQVLDRLIMKTLQLAAAKQAGIIISDVLLARAVKNIAAENGMSPTEFRVAVESEGISFHAFREDIREQITLTRLRDQRVIRRIEVSERELDAYLDKAAGQFTQRSDYHISHILITTPDGASAEQINSAKKKAEQLVVRLRTEGASFKEIAIAESEGRNALEGGDLGWRNAAQLPSMFIDILAGMESGGISNPIRNSSGFHIIRLNGYKGGERQIITQTLSRHILIRTNEITSDKDAENRLQQLRQRIEGGDDFGALARSHSDDKGSAIKGGDLGWVSPGDLVPKFEATMDALEKNEISHPFKSQFGWHIVQVLDRKEYDNTENVQRTQARNAIRERKANEEGELYLRRLRDEAYIEIRLSDS
ncbi:Periplasmic chaperone and peptidyl-prolyl cis-trans isomerase of outer membrane proteins SurA [hydrothermal vent metagenome]|uniref:Periplasmic chaperone and peptidyl-prolyl cis-trans isomerase of outer membrane proteins SurA n=1 Tax=hydrothermal vent metagenome TaxID=652676 RepID=A0A3B1BMC3_9ZZZZ